MRSSLSFPPFPPLFSFSSLSRFFIFSIPLFSLSLSLFKFSFPPSPPILLPLSLYSPPALPLHLPSFALALFEAPAGFCATLARAGVRQLWRDSQESWRETGRLSRVLPSPEGGPRAFRRRLRNRGVSLRKLCDVLLEDCETVGRPPLSALSFRRVVTIQRREGEGAKGEDGRRICIRGSPITGSITPGHQVCRVLMFRWPPPSPQRFNIHAPVTP